MIGILLRMMNVVLTEALMESTIAAHQHYSHSNHGRQQQQQHAQARMVGAGGRRGGIEDTGTGTHFDTTIYLNNHINCYKYTTRTESISHLSGYISHYQFLHYGISNSHCNTKTLCCSPNYVCFSCLQELSSEKGLGPQLVKY